jgi:hypothetical protein
MLIDIHTEQVITYRRNDWWRKMLKNDLPAIKAELNALIDAGDVHVSSWMPGSDWSGTPYQPIYEKAAGGDVEEAAKIFGQIVWEVFQERPERWASQPAGEIRGKPVNGRTYFRLQH